jgi:FAD:protein FMN transferase
MTMKQTRLLMGMPITIDVADTGATQQHLDEVYAYFEYIDDTFSTYKTTSEISRLNRGDLNEDDCSEDMRTMLDLAEQTTRETNGYFDIRHDGMRDPSGIVKGWSIRNAASILGGRGFRNFYVDAGGDAAISGLREGHAWHVGIRSPFMRHEVVKVLGLSDCGVATSGTAIRGQHIYNPHRPHDPIVDILSVTVVGPDVCDADRYATAAFAMGREGIHFIATLPGYEGYMIDAQARAVYTSGFERYVVLT